MTQPDMTPYTLEEIEEMRDLIRLTSISATAPAAAAETEPTLTEKRVRELICQGNEWDSGFGVRFRSRHQMHFPRG